MATAAEAYRAGFVAGVTAYAYSSSERWAESGVQYVGTSGRTLALAIDRVEETWNYNPPTEEEHDAPAPASDA